MNFFRLQYLADISKKINEVSLSFQEKFLADRCRLKFWKSIPATEFGSFPNA